MLSATVERMVCKVTQKHAQMLFYNIFDLMYVSSQHQLPENGVKLRSQKWYTYTILYRANNSQITRL